MHSWARCACAVPHTVTWSFSQAKLEIGSRFRGNCLFRLFPIGFYIKIVCLQITIYLSPRPPQKSAKMGYIAATLLKGIFNLFATGHARSRRHGDIGPEYLFTKKSFTGAGWYWWHGDRFRLRHTGNRWYMRRRYTASLVYA